MSCTVSSVLFQGKKQTLILLNVVSASYTVMSMRNTDFFFSDTQAYNFITWLRLGKVPVMNTLQCQSSNLPIKM